MIKYLSLALLLLLTSTGCFAPQNNYLETSDFVTLLKKEGLPVGETRVIPAEPVRASTAIAVKVGDSEIGIYKYDRTSDFQKTRLDKIKESKRVYITGIPYPAEVYGSFMFFGLEKNKHKRAILKVIRKFR